MSPSYVLRYAGPAVILAAVSACHSPLNSVDPLNCAPSVSRPCDTSPVVPIVTISSIKVTGERRVSGYAYRVVLQLREAAGVAATISSVDLTFSTATTVVISSHHNQPISDSTNVCPASVDCNCR